MERINKPYKISESGMSDNTGAIRVPKAILDNLEADIGDFILWEYGEIDGVKVGVIKRIDIEPSTHGDD